MPLRGEDERQLRAEPDTEQGRDTNPGRDKDEQAWRADNTPVAHSQCIYSTPIDDLPDFRHQDHAACYNEITNSEHAKGEALKTIPGKSSYGYTCCQTAAGSKLIKAHKSHTTR